MNVTGTRDTTALSGSCACVRKVFVSDVNAACLNDIFMGNPTTVPSDTRTMESTARSRESPKIVVAEEIWISSLSPTGNPLGILLTKISKMRQRKAFRTWRRNLNKRRFCWLSRFFPRHLSGSCALPLISDERRPSFPAKMAPSSHKTFPERTSHGSIQKPLRRQIQGDHLIK